MKKILISLFLVSASLCLKAQNTIGKSKEDIRNMVKSNPNFKLLTGENRDTLVFTEGMQAIFEYKGNVCYKSISVLPLKYMPSITEKMTTDSYKKLNDSTWTDSKEAIKVMITVKTNERKCLVTTTSYEKQN